MKLNRLLLRVFWKHQIRFLIVNSFTIAALLLGLASLALTMAGLLNVAALCLLGCVLLDGCDGNLARKWQVTSPFGAQLDSLADMTSFGVAAAMLAYYWLSHKSSELLLPVGTVSALVALMSAIRLARFNVAVKSERYFSGIPTTFVAAVIAAVYLTSPSLQIAWAIVGVGVLAVLMVSAFPYLKLTELRALPRWVVLAVLIGCAVNLGATVLVVAILYMSSGPVIWWRDRRAVRQLS